MTDHLHRHQDNEDFVAAFADAITKLAESDMRELMSLGQYTALGHPCWDVDHDVDHCDNCYSGDTQYEYGSGCQILGDIWMKVAKELDLDVCRVPTAAGEDSQFSEDADEGDSYQEDEENE